MNIELIIRKRLAIVSFLFCCVQLLVAQQTITEIKELPIGSVVTTTGIVISGSEFGVIRYMQDASAGIPVYSMDLESTKPGDSLLLVGVLSNYKGQIQISPVISFSILASSLPLPAPISIDLETNNEPYEGMLVNLTCMGIASCEPEIVSGWYTIYDPQGNTSRLDVYSDEIGEGHDLGKSSFSAKGIWVYQNGQYQLLAQQLFDKPEVSCDLISPASSFPIFGHTGLIWEVSFSDGYFVEFGDTAFTSTENVFVSNQQVEFVFTQLSQGQLYKARLGHVGAAGDTTYSIPTLLSALSPESEIEIYFNRNVDTTYSDGSKPDGVGASVIESDVISRIDQVTATLDIAMYNSSRVSIIQAVNRAAQRGVVVRYLAEDETSNSALEGTLSFPVLYRSGDGIMHNKFIIGDAGDPGRAWLWTGSTNHSANQLASDPNNALIFHDQSLALNYQREFEEFWGDGVAHNNALYGEGKTDNTAHNFYLGEKEIESYFSPSDETSCHIMEAIRTADHHLEVALLLLTKEDLVDELISLHLKGVKVRVILEDEESSSLAVSRLRQAGIQTFTHDISNIFHHKYAIIDEGHIESNPQVITGSHNWTFSADNINDENTLIIHDQSVA
ncbi:MAG: phospholipase D-like domain-containing protein, partial [Bacteroidota bacterium]|nr:phospholipase D-like domain-containing protein [Bacteroidota bacterium]